MEVARLSWKMSNLLTLSERFHSNCLKIRQLPANCKLLHYDLNMQNINEHFITCLFMDILSILQARCEQYFNGFCLKVKRTNQKFLLWKISQSINIRWLVYDSNDQQFSLWKTKITFWLFNKDRKVLIKKKTHER